MSEADFRAEVIELAAKHGVLVHACLDGRKCAGDKGCPDLLLVGSYGTMFVELKSDYGQLKPEQTTWRYRLIAAGGTGSWDIWRPDDLDSGAIEEVLATL